MEHDYCYSSNIPKSECDKNMLGKLSYSDSKTIGEKVAKNLNQYVAPNTKNSVWVKKRIAGKKS